MLVNGNVINKAILNGVNLSKMLVNSTDVLNISPSIVTNGLQLFLQGKNFTNNPPTTSLLDESGMGNNGVPSGMAYTTSSGSDELGNIVYDGVNDVLNCGRSSTLDFTNTITIGIKLTLINTPSVYGRLISKEIGIGTTCFALVLDTTRHIIFYIGGVACFTSTIALTLNTETYVTITYNKTTIKLYLNGILEQSTAYTTSIPVSPCDLNIMNNPSLSRGLNCKMKHVELYNSILSDAEILQNSNF